MRFAIRIFICLCLTIAAGVGEQSDGSAYGASRAESKEVDVKVWVQQLDSDEFLHRKEATEKLIESGISAVQPISDAIASGSREVVARGIFILRELALSEDTDIEVACLTALKELAVSEKNPASSVRSAMRALNQVFHLRQDGALECLKAAGAKVDAMKLNNVPLQAVVIGAAKMGGELRIDGNWKGGIDDLRQLRYIVDCFYLRLTGLHVSNDWLDAVAQMPSLKQLDLNQTSVDNEGIAKLRQIRPLQSLRIRYSPVSDGVIEVLRKMDQLQHVELEGTDVTSQGAQALSEQLAGSKIEFRRGGFLGVGEARGLLQGPGSGFRIGHVQVGSAAEKAGIHTGDIILKFNGEKVTNFDALRELIGKNKVGEVVDIRILRNSKSLGVKVTLGRRMR